MSPSSAHPLLEAHDLTATLPGDDGPLRVLDGVSLRVAAGEIVDVTGPSGSGKTTLLRALSLLLPGAIGELRHEGSAAAGMRPEQWRSLVTLLPQKPALVAGDVGGNLLVPWGLKVRRHLTPPSAGQIREMLDRVGLHDVATERNVSRLSVGQHARVALARVLLTAPSVLLLDEPDAALDPDSAAAVARVLAEFAEGGGAVLRVRHRESDGLASRRLRLAGGTLEEVAAG